ncbi:hypothetical protein AB0A74_24700 [Saccharothrix sp. NPDC042600]|uniref:hypothetical protein n=1 Tax=Saccharothrix TaxID=2071 RepID=UPI00340DAF03|nr:hypothetical protein GCM10017745_18150 [Saccharothrix mutabilis subsp. capreolus]
MGAVKGTISYRESDDAEGELLPFGQWLFKTIMRESQGDEWGHLAYHKDNRSSRHLYLWLETLEEDGKNADHFRDKEHLHLIDNDTDVDISTKHPQALNIGADGRYEKRTAADKTPEHLTGTKALNRGESLPITVCTKNEPPNGVVAWQRELIATLRATIVDWLRAAGASNTQIAEFRA